MRTLKQTGQYDDTVIVFTSDNGYFLGEHRQRPGKIKPHEPSLRVPLVIAGPGIPHGVRRGARHHHRRDGDDPRPGVGVAARTSTAPRRCRSFEADRPWTVPVVTEGLQHLPARRSAASPHGLTEMGLRTGRYAYFRYSTGEGELYDLATDPLELRSRYDDPAYAAGTSRPGPGSGATTASAPPPSAALRSPGVPGLGLRGWPRSPPARPTRSLGTTGGEAAWTHGMRVACL